MSPQTDADPDQVETPDGVGQRETVLIPKTAVGGGEFADPAQHYHREHPDKSLASACGTGVEDGQTAPAWVAEFRGLTDCPEPGCFGDQEGDQR